MTDKTASDFDETKAPIMEHLVELRQRLIWVMAGIFVTFLICFYFSKEIYIILVLPFKNAMMNFYGASEVAKSVQLITTSPQELFIVYVKLALFGAIFLAFPIIATQLYMFIAPGLYKSERESFLPFLIAAPLLFILGAALVYFVAMPMALNFFLGMQISEMGSDGTKIEVSMLPRAMEYLGLIMTLILAFGVCFQLPLILTLMAKTGLIGAQGLKSKRKHALLGIAVVAMFLTPPDPLSLIALIIPTYLLYEVSIFSVAYVERKRDEEDVANKE